jgi:hypothetical protein
MRRVLAFLALALVLPASAAAKDSNAPVHVLWNSSPAGTRPAGTWDARISVMQEPGGLYFGHVRPVLVVTDMATNETRRIRTTIDIPPNTFKALVPFPHAGDYSVTVTRFHPRHLDYTANIGRPISIAAPRAPAASPARDDGAPWWPWALVGAAVLLSAAAGARHLRHRARRPVDDEVAAVRRLA